MSTVFLSFLDNHRPLSSPVSIFRTDSTPINLCKGRKHSAPRIGYRAFHCQSPLLILCMSTVFLSFLDNHRPLSSPVSIFLTNSAPISLCKARKHSAARIGDDDFRGGCQEVILLLEHSVSQFSRQPPTPFESRFNFPDRFDKVEHRQRPKTFGRANRRRRF